MTLRWTLSAVLLSTATLLPAPAFAQDGGDGDEVPCGDPVTGEDTTPPTILSVVPDQGELWPPSHAMTPVALAIEVEDDCDADPVCEIVGLESDEPVDGRGDGHTSPDWEVTGPLATLLRAERSGYGDGRVYTVTVRCTDASGNESTMATTVGVPHDRGEPIVDDGTANRCIFKVNLRRPGKDLLLARLDVVDAIGDLPPIGSDALADDVAGYELVLTIGAETISGTFDSEGRLKSKSPALRARLTESAFLIVHVRGLDLVSALGLDPAEDLRGFPVEVMLRAELIPPAGVEGVAFEPIELFDDFFHCEYRQKANAHGKGKKRGRRRR